MIDIDAASRFVWGNARLLDRHRLAHALGIASAEPVVDAVRAYRNPDGGFGHGLEPDLRTPSSQPGAVRTALAALEEAEALEGPMVADACDWLTSVALPDGSIPFVLPSAADAPRAPWWAAASTTEPSLAMTGLNVAILLRGGVRHPWVDGASAWCWARADEPAPRSAYDALALAAFLDAAPDRERADAAAAALVPQLVELGVIALEPQEEGETHTPLDYAPLPEQPLRRLFAAEAVERHLDALEAGQEEDGGWRFGWLAWSPAAALEWRGALTVEALRVLAANGRVALGAV